MTAERFRNSQQLARPALVELYDIDITKYGGGIRRWTPGPIGGPAANLIWNPTPKANTTGWSSLAGATMSLASTVYGTQFPAYAPEEGSGIVFWSSLAANSVTNFSWTQSPTLTAGTYVQVQARVLPQRCRVKARIEFYNVASLISVTDGAWVGDSGQTSPAGSVDNYLTIWVSGIAPAGTTRAILSIVVVPFTDGVAATSPVVSFARASMIMSATPFSTTKPREYAPGGKVGSVSFGGAVYSPLPLRLEGLEKSGRGAVPRVTVVIPDIDGLLTTLLLTYKNLLGCPITRKLVFRNALDDGPDADPSDYFGPDIYYIDRVARHAPGVDVALECCSPLDIQGTALPARQVIRDICDLTYRVWNGSSFDYGSCPYAGSNYWDVANNSTTSAASDRCSKSLRGCRLRYGTSVPLPMAAFPGVGRGQV
jgi:lambda family phage minor tail protein L